MLTITPDLPQFLDLAQDRRVISVYAKIVADTVTPTGLYQQLCGTRPGTFLFESADNGVWSRYSFIGVEPVGLLTGVGQSATWTWTGPPMAGLVCDGNPLQALQHALTVLHTPRDPLLPPLTSGMVGFLGYDAVRLVENLPDSNPTDLPVPELGMYLVRDMAVVDHHTGEVWLISNAINFDGSPDRADQAYRNACGRVQSMVETVTRGGPPYVAQVKGSPQDTDVQRQRSAQEYEQIVRDVVEEIGAGEAFQVVLSQRFSVPCRADALDVYRVLRRRNPSPYLYLFRHPAFDIVGSSPEALVRVTEGRATTYPIAGTKPRGTTPEEDAALEAELLGDEKEKAEHLMLVDLGRNDLGRVCQPGTVAVTEFMKVRRYSHVMHLEAAVTGLVNPDRSALDVTMACFPPGTLSGAPKVRAMQLIDELETTRRGIYGGVIGYFDFAGDSDTAIAIRTALLRDNIAYVQAGAGIVADSNPVNENQECMNKAGAVIAAIREANTLYPVEHT